MDRLIIVSVIIAYLPSSYIDPLLMPVLLTYLMYKGVKKKSLKIFLIYFTISIISLIVVYINYNVLLNSYFVKTFAISVFISPFFIKRNEYIFSNRTITILTNILLIESIIGCLQYAVRYFITKNLLAIGDVVEGTLHLPFATAGGLTHQSFLITQILLTSFLFYYYSKNAFNNRAKLTIVLAVLSIILASVIHMLFALIVSIGIVLFYEQLKSAFKFRISKFAITAFLLLIVLSISSFSFLESRIMLLDHYYKVAITQTERFGKIQMVENYIEESKSKPIFFFTGLGPGQYNSRSAMIFSGEYLNSKNVNSLIKQINLSQRSDLYFKHVDKYVKLQKSDDYTWGSTGSPSSSVISIVAEHGLLFIIFIISSYLILLKKIRKDYRLFSIVMILFLILTSFQENYLEMTSQILPFFIILGRLNEY